MAGRINPADVANSFIRNILSDAGALLGGLPADKWKETLEFFEYRCAYTGVLITQEKLVMDHIIPHNRAFCGLHLFGNVVPATQAANQARGNTSYPDFLRSTSKILEGIPSDERERRIDRIRLFVVQSEYESSVAALGDLRAYCSKQYQDIKRLCAESRSYLEKQLSHGS